MACCIDIEAALLPLTQSSPPSCNSDKGNENKKLFIASTKQSSKTVFILSKCVSSFHTRKLPIWVFSNPRSEGEIYMTQVCLAVFIEVPDQDILNMFGWRKNDFINKTHLILSRSTQSSYFVAAVLFAASPEKM